MYQRFLKTKPLEFLIFFVTSKCNSNCKHCFNKINLNSKNDLNLDEIKLISQNLPDFKTLLLSGGEPFLRKELAKIVELFYFQNNISNLSIPTNGFLSNQIYEMTKQILDFCPKIKLTLNFSIDGLEKIQDSLRGVEKSFANCLKSLTLLQELKVDYPNLNIQVNSIVSEKNYGSLFDLMIFLKKFNLDGHYLELIRGNFEKSTNAELLKLYKQNIALLKRHYLNKLFKKSNLRFLRKVNHLGKIIQLYKLQLNILKHHKLPFLCHAGQNIGVIQSNGDVHLCEPLSAIGNLKSSNYNFHLLWNSLDAQKQRKTIKSDKCACTHCVFLLKSIENNFFSFFIKSPYYYAKNYLFGGL